MQCELHHFLCPGVHLHVDHYGVRQSGAVRWYATLTPNTTLHTTVSIVIPRIYKLPSVDVPVPGNVSQLIILRATSSLVNVLTHVSVLLTFGAIFPPVALAMAVSTTAVVYISIRNMQTFVRAAVDVGQFEYVDVVNGECAGVGARSQLIVAARIVICFCCLFYTLFLFDTLGDAQGFGAAVWVLVVVPCAPFVVYGVGEVYRVSAPIKAVRTESSAGTEMSSVPAIKSETSTINVLHDSV